MDQRQLTAAEAAAEVDRTAAKVRRRGQWPAWMFLALGAVNFVFFVIVGSGNRALANALIPLPALSAVVLFLIAARQPVVGRDAQKINRPVARAALVTVVVGLIIDQTVLPRHFTGWLLLLAAVMVAPYLIGAGRWLRR